VSLSKEPAYSELKNHFVCGYRNIMGEPYAGNSGTHKPNGNAVDTTNGAGPHNIQMFVMNPDGTVVHCLPGFWNPQDLVSELVLARKLNDLYCNHEYTADVKAKQFASLQNEHVRFHTPEMAERSHLQGFDAKHEAHNPNSDFIKDRAILAEEWNSHSCEGLKTTDIVMHERMAKRPFMTYGQFDTAQYANYGTETYDKHEDSMDESGSKIAEEGPMKFEPIKNAKTMEQARKEAAAHPSALTWVNKPGTPAAAVTKPKPPASYVHTYGQLRRHP
jgi:hypothetical protein